MSSQLYTAGSDAGKVRTQYHGNWGSKHRTIDTGDSGRDYLILPAFISDDDCQRIWEDTGRDWAGSGRCGHSHDCCGCISSYDVELARDAHRVVITQYWFRNV